MSRRRDPLAHLSTIERGSSGIARPNFALIAARNAKLHPLEEDTVHAALHKLAAKSILTVESRNSLLNVVPDPAGALKAWVSLAKAHYKTPPLVLSEVPVIKFFPSSEFLTTLLIIIGVWAHHKERKQRKAYNWRWDTLRGIAAAIGNSGHKLLSEITRFGHALIEDVVSRQAPDGPLGQRCFNILSFPNDILNLTPPVDEPSQRLSVFGILQQWRSKKWQPSEEDLGILEHWISPEMRMPEGKKHMLTSMQNEAYRESLTKLYCAVLNGQCVDTFTKLRSLWTDLEPLHRWITDIGCDDLLQAFDKKVQPVGISPVSHTIRKMEKAWEAQRKRELRARKKTELSSVSKNCDDEDGTP